MARKRFIGLLVMLFCMSWGFSMTAMARDQSRIPENSGKSPQDPAKIWLRKGGQNVILDTPEVKDQMDIARQLAGDDFYLLHMQRLQCRDLDDTYTVRESPGSNSIRPGVNGWKEVAAVPTQVFDNVYYVGGMEVGGWLIDTGDGFVMLDSSYDYGYEEILLPNMAALGLDPAQVKYILITHAGPDHKGAAPYFQQDYGTKIVFDSEIKGIDTTVMNDGDTLTLGDTTITMVKTPRNVGGTGFSYIIPVKIDGKRHMWGTFGNTNAVGGTIDDKFEYRISMAKFLSYVDGLGVDIAISSHPFVDASLDRMDIIRKCREHRNFHDPLCHTNPFLIGKRAAIRYFEILDQCSEVQRKRQEAGIYNTGIGCMDGYELDADTGKCTEIVCPQGYEVVGNACVEECEEGYARDGRTGECVEQP